MSKGQPVRNLHKHVVDELGQRIVGGLFAPGASLPREEALAESMVVSRTALREAMKVLGAKGLIETRQKTGSRVRDKQHWNQLDADVLNWRCAAMPTDDFIAQLVEMREIVEPAAAASAARNRDRSQLARINAAYKAMAAAADLDAWVAADFEFHEAVLTATNNELLQSLFHVIATALQTFFQLSARKAKDFKYSLPLHFEVSDAIRLRRPDAAREAMRHMVTDSGSLMQARKTRRVTAA
ncbi:FadR/GntR family transcriptional regulator [Dyella tabacisoli]|uniref:FadR family transcriptional regulator n=1 Tax=Dyella tabacisoli TaxID=2282381 RepID=A0A369UNP8_9GAMM|nr:FadR/GntR family transcriptional regulator [Dyella tabacisoli]RDD82161.1 FadR family transcriptional regulator [Dyella tabacisoli]